MVLCKPISRAMSRKSLLPVKVTWAVNVSTVLVAATFLKYRDRCINHKVMATISSPNGTVSLPVSSRSRPVHIGIPQTGEGCYTICMLASATGACNSQILRQGGRKWLRAEHCCTWEPLESRLEVAVWRGTFLTCLASAVGSAYPSHLYFVTKQ